MLLVQLHVIVSVILGGRSCLSNLMIETNKLDVLAGMEDAVIQILTTCYADQDKTVLLMGNFSVDFIKKLSSHQDFSLVSLDGTGRAENNTPVYDVKEIKRHKVHLVVTMAADLFRSVSLWNRYEISGYDNSKASVIVLGWSPDAKYCYKGYAFIDMLYNTYLNGMLNVNLMCQRPSKGLELITMNPFVNHAPASWKLIIFANLANGQRLYAYSRNYREGKEMCRNLDFDKTHDLGRSEIATTHFTLSSEVVKDGSVPAVSSNRRVRIEDYKRFSFIDSFIDHVNARRRYVWQRLILGQMTSYDDKSFPIRPQHLGNDDFIEGVYHTYPHVVECVTFVTQFRGYKTQLQKIISVIDNDSWIGMLIAYLITLIFLKFFLRQPLTVGFLNLCRLSCNCGLVIPSFLNAGSQIYLVCLLWFFVTMQGIFQGNLASLLTHDFPDRQADTIQDLVELGYKIYTDSAFLPHFHKLAFTRRIHLVSPNEDCFELVVHDPLGACVIWGVEDIEQALGNNLYVSPNCIAEEYVCHRIPKRWFLEERIGKFLGMTIATSTMMPFGVRVEEKRMHEAESVGVVLEPEIMTFQDLRFAFVILGIGLSCAFITFILEKVIFPFHNVF